MSQNFPTEYREPDAREEKIKASLASSEMWGGVVQFALVGAFDVASAQTNGGNWWIVDGDVGGEGVIFDKEVTIGAGVN